jgi:FdhD protein
MKEISDSIARVPVQRWEADSLENGFDVVAEEVPVALEYNGISHTVMLASPKDLEDFALGYSLTEGIADSIRDVTEFDIAATEKGIRVSMQIAGRCFARLKAMRRSMTGRTGCGLCGVENLRQVRRNLDPVRSIEPMDVASFQIALNHLGAFQSLHTMTGATHAAGWILASGDIVCAREDVGRHNALDKLIGALACEGRNFATGAVLMTSRASYEIVQKAASVGIGIIAAISAPTALAVRLAEALNVTLIGFLRPNRHVCYANGERIRTGARV